MAKLILYQAKSPYPGDVTKNCALTGKEVDNNFLNLKGEDIEKIYLDEETKKLTFTRFKNGLKNCNGETIDAEIEIDLTKLEYVTGYKYEDGVIKITYSNGKTAEMPIEAFGMSVATDSTIAGNGSKSKPLSISQAMRTGQYQPVNYNPANGDIPYIDIENGERLPGEAVNGEGYVTKEVKSDFGLFYNADQALLLDGILKHENSEWRVPTKKDWDTLLNYLEECDRYKNHGLRSETDIDARGMKLGNLAGFKAKSLDTADADYWANCGANNADILRIYPSGSFSALTGAYSGFGNHAWFWTLTEGDMSCRNFYSKMFDDCVGTVTQIEAMPDTKLTIRLVKDFLGDNYNQFEDIHGRVYETALFASESDECNQVWTMVSVDISDPQWNLIPTPMPKDASTAITATYAYYINRWDGKKWDKHEMVEGDCLDIVNGEKGYDDESRVDEYRLERDLDGVLYLRNMDEYWENKIEEVASAATEAIEDLQEQIDDLNEKLDEEISARTEADEELWEGLNEEISARTEADEELWDALNDEISARTEADEVLNDMITAETQAREEEDERLWEALSAETQAREEADEELHDMITAETQAREEADQELRDTIGNVNDIPSKRADEYKPEDLILCGGTMSVFEFINSTNDYGYWETPNEPED